MGIFACAVKDADTSGMLSGRTRIFPRLRSADSFGATYQAGYSQLCGHRDDPACPFSTNMNNETVRFKKARVVSRPETEFRKEPFSRGRRRFLLPC